MSALCVRVVLSRVRLPQHLATAVAPNIVDLGSHQLMSNCVATQIVSCKIGLPTWIARAG